MSISEKIVQVAANQSEISGKLNAIAAWLEKDCGLRVNFCRIFGRRWSYFAGDRQMEFAPNRHQLSPQYGIFYMQNIPMADGNLERILQALTQFLTGIDHV